VSDKEYFRVDASLMHQLGASLISDDLQCLVELIKNAYDADAPNVKIIIDAPDRIVVEDNGHGMDFDVIVRGWLTISNSLKLEQKRKGILTSLHNRTPLGDKGLGRLSTQRLGNSLRIESTTGSSDDTIVVEIDWTLFAPGRDLASIPVGVERQPRGGRTHGTKLTITSLVNSEEWSSLSPDKLRLNLASLVSPYEEVASFRIQAFLNGVEVSPSPLAANVRRSAGQQYRVEFDGLDLRIKGALRGQTLRGTTTKSKEDFERYFESDQGQDFFDYLNQDRKSLSYSLDQSVSEGFFISFAVSRTFQDIVGVRSYSNPGPFEGEVDSFSLDATATAETRDGIDALNTSAEAKRLVKDLSGIRVYRDGFVIKTAHDWLKLGEGQTSGGSFYGLRPFNTMGYVSISATKNRQLRETTDREGFIEDSFYKGFFEVLHSFIKTVNDVLEHLRRAWTAFIKEKEREQHDLPSRDPRVIEDRLNDSFSKVGSAKSLLGAATESITKAIAEDSQSLFPSSGNSAERLSDVQDLLIQASQTLEEVGTKKGLAGLLVAELDSLNARLGEVYELVSLGITAEALSHDISVVLERLSVETNTTQKHARSANLDDLRILRYFEVVRTAVSALEKQLGHLDPALKYVRERRDLFSVCDLVRDSSTYYKERFGKNSINLEIECVGDFNVSMNKGKLIQILDNLVLNSEYWVKASIRKQGGNGWVRLRVQRPNIVVEDSGEGVEPAFEETLFDPFITAKPKGEGRGLGLFIATQLLELDSCRLSLLPDRNTKGRRFKIAIDLTGVVSGG
jgi:signal transduction histidine kinase